MVDKDNALKRAMIPVLKAMTWALRGYSGWAVANRAASNVIIGLVIIVYYGSALFMAVALWLIMFEIGLSVLGVS